MSVDVCLMSVYDGYNNKKQGVEIMVKDKDVILTTEEAAELLKVKPITVREWARDGKIQGKKLGRQWRFSKKTLIDYVEGK